MEIAQLALIVSIYFFLEIIGNVLQEIRVRRLERRIEELEITNGNHPQRQDHHH